jgi:hypothetical protein
MSGRIARRSTAAGAAARGAIGLILALGFPAAPWNVTAGQNGVLTAALIGANRQG